MAKFVAYYRVSTFGQGASGLGLEAQRRAVLAYIQSVSGELVAEYQEVESGGNKLRPVLGEAIKLARRQKAMLVIAKLDRLARSVNFISKLMESGLEFVVADMPHANKLTMHIISAVAEYEREVIAQRTKDALKAAKARGKRLGNPKAKEQVVIARAAAVKQADEFASKIAPFVNAMRREGVRTLTGISRELNAREIKTQRGKDWTPTGVRNLLKRIEKQCPGAA